MNMRWNTPKLTPKDEPEGGRGRKPTVPNGWQPGHTPGEVRDILASRKNPHSSPNKK